MSPHKQDKKPFIAELQERFPSLTCGKFYTKSTWQPNDYYHPGDLSNDLYEETLVQTVDINISLDDLKRINEHLEYMKKLDKDLEVQQRTLIKYKSYLDSDIAKAGQLRVVLANNPEVSEQWEEMRALLRLHGLENEIPIGAV